MRKLIFDSEISDPCDASKSHHDIIDELRDDVCANNLSMIGLEDVLDGAAMEDKIIIDNSLKNSDNCSQLYCIYKMLKEDNSSWCNTFGSFEDLENRHLKLQVGTQNTLSALNYFELSDDNRNRSAITTFNANNEIVVAFNPSLCNSNPLHQALNILHEGHHADLFRYIEAHLLEDQVLNEMSIEDFNIALSELFNLICQEPDTEISTQHKIMLNRYVDDIARGLWEFNGQNSDWENYRWVAYIGVWDEGSPCSLEVLTTDERDELQSNFTDNVDRNITIDPCN